MEEKDGLNYDMNSYSFLQIVTFYAQYRPNQLAVSLYNTRFHDVAEWLGHWIQDQKVCVSYTT